MKQRNSTNTLVLAGGMAFLVAVTLSDRDPTPFTGLLVVLFVLFLAIGLRQRSTGD